MGQNCLLMREDTDARSDTNTLKKKTHFFSCLIFILFLCVELTTIRGLKTT